MEDILEKLNNTKDIHRLNCIWECQKMRLSEQKMLWDAFINNNELLNLMVDVPLKQQVE